MIQFVLRFPRQAPDRFWSDIPYPAVALGQGFWTSHFGSDPAGVGSSIRLNGTAATIIGITAREVSGLGSDSPAFCDAASGGTRPAARRALRVHPLMALRCD